MNSNNTEQTAATITCTCGNENSNLRYRTCDTCRERRRNAYARRRNTSESGNPTNQQPSTVRSCSRCGRENTNVIYNNCDSCRESVRSYYYRNRDNEEVNSSVNREAAIVQRCTDCGNVLANTTHSICESCQSNMRVRGAIREISAGESRVRGRRRQIPIAFKSQIHRLQRLDLGSMDQICYACNAKHWIGEMANQNSSTRATWMSCCKSGEVQVDFLRETPSYLKDLYDDLGDRGIRFRDNIRRYNSVFAFSSIRCENVNSGIGNMPFQIHGQMYHIQGPLALHENEEARYAQLYIYDPHYAASVRASHYSSLDRGVIESLTLTLHEVNSLVRIYKFAFEVLSAADANNAVDPFIIVSPSLRMSLMSGNDRRTQNLPSSDEVALILPDDSSAEGFRDVRIYLRSSSSNDSFTRISQNHAMYMPSHYTLLFPYGEMGWHWGLRLRNGGRLCQRAYYRFRLHLRDNEYPIIFKAKRLFQQFLVDIWAICDQNKLDWIRANQNRIRADLYGGLEDALIADDVNASGRGRMILPSSFTGGPRFMAKLYQNSMAIVRHFGKPSLFITFTANPRWIEIQRELLPGQVAQDRPDLVSRVFNLKVRELLKDIKEKKIFGSYKGLVRTVEYQKRGLPHLHLLLFLDQSLNINTKEQIDEVISAEIPSKIRDPELYDIVTRNMVHGPCGDINPRSPCMFKDRYGVTRCSKNFPKHLYEDTIVNENGYPHYKRSYTVNEEDRYYINDPRDRRNQIEIDNRWIVPYNPYLSKKFNAHINVECCQGVASIKYINKYVYKGSDRTTLRLSDTRDEIEKYLQGRYIGPTEAFARIFEYKMHEEDPTVILLALHLPNEQPVYFEENATRSELEQSMNRSYSMLMGYFQYYVDHPNESVRHLYQDFPQHFVWKDRVWKPRQRGFAIGRIPYCNPLCGEKYYLRLLLINVAGSTSFDDLKTINGNVCVTFKQACLERHLIQNDQEWTHCFTEAQVFSSGSSLRNLFVVALTFGQLANAELLWIEFCDSICDDLQQKLLELFPNDETYVYYDNSRFYYGSPVLDYGLYLIDIKLREEGRSLEDYHLPTYDHDWNTALSRVTPTMRSVNTLINEQLAYHIVSEENAYRSKYALFNDDQKSAFDRIVQQIESADSTERQNVFFLHGPAGTGKTFVYNTIANYFRSKTKIVLCVASSGIAALLLTGGRTSHSRFRIPLSVNEGSTCYIPRGSFLSELIRQTALIIWDEVPMQHKHCFETVDRTLRDVREEDSLFGGIPVILGGDFAQIAPVVRHGDRPDIVNASIRQSYIWNRIEVIHLRINMRIRGTAMNDMHFKDWLFRMTYNAEFQNKSIALPSYIYNTTSLHDLIDRVYPQDLLSNIIHRSQTLYKSAILATRNDSVDDLNRIILNLIPGNSIDLASADEVDFTNSEADEVFQVTPEYLQTLNPNNFPPARLSLKVGCIVMLLRNINPGVGLCNGTRMIIKEIGTYVLRVAVLKDSNDGVEQIEFIPRITLLTLEDEYPFILRRVQFPVKLSFAMTINKSQGQSLQNVGIDLRIPPFTHGQLYVALSRSTNVGNISILHDENTTDNTIENIVYPEILL